MSCVSPPTAQFLALRGEIPSPIWLALASPPLFLLSLFPCLRLPAVVCSSTEARPRGVRALHKWIRLWEAFQTSEELESSSRKGRGDGAVISPADLRNLKYRPPQVGKWLVKTLFLLYSANQRAKSSMPARLCKHLAGPRPFPFRRGPIGIN